MQTLTLYNTLTRQKEVFSPVNPESTTIGMYSCGPTVYGIPHIGNIRAFFTADLIRNTLELAGYTVKSVMNITDVGHLVGDGDEGEDKLEVGAKREGLTAQEIARKYEQEFLSGLEQIHIAPFTKFPRATEHIQEQINMVKILQEKGYTYDIPDDGIYMDTSKIDDYGKLLGPNYKKHLKNLRGGERVEMGGKKNITDFALWKFAKKSDIGEGKREMERESPRGIGFPGRHVECSAMATKYLGEQFDIHHGGADHISIHHPNEITQSECCFDKKPRVKYWMHNQFLQVDGGKMSKSLGNVYTLDDLVKKGYSPLDLRYFFFMAHYRSFQDFTWENLTAAQNARKNLKKKIAKHSHQVSPVMGSIQQSGTERSEKEGDNKEKYQKILAVLFDDLNTPKLLAEINALLKNPSEEDISILKYLDDNFLKLDLFAEEISEYTSKADGNSSIPEKIIVLAEQRKQAKVEKNYTLADELRDKIQLAGYTIKDTPEGYSFE